MQNVSATDEIITQKKGSVGLIRLNRPKAINSLNEAMVSGMKAGLDLFARDADVTSVVLCGEGERGLCAGGDVRLIYEARSADEAGRTRFWREEFPLNERISNYPKPYIALMDGIVMGGGVGISAHGRYRIVTERTRLAMPETGIGYFPDVGATWLLPHAPGEFGTYLGLTGRDIGATDAIHARLADHYVPTAKLDELFSTLAALPPSAKAADVDAAIQGVADEVPPSPLAAHLKAIDRCFAFDTVEEILAALEAENSDFGRETLALLRSRSALSMALSLDLLRAGRKSASLNECLEREYSATLGMLSNPDFYEGVRAAVIDKDRNPRWSVGLSDVTEEKRAQFTNRDHLPLFVA